MPLERIVIRRMATANAWAGADDDPCEFLAIKIEFCAPARPFVDRKTKKAASSLCWGLLAMMDKQGSYASRVGRR